MRQVKFFWSTDERLSELQNEINQWIYECKIELMDAKYQSVMNKDGYVLDTVMIIYEDLE